MLMLCYIIGIILSSIFIFTLAKASVKRNGKG
ncbi:hypothetical protein bsdtw1_01751 [Clostridium fungisolvens]|uniref:Uncharacterized protein n=1 Tax=Clostridium fungisolvens TaxID=1604897 RepID=A0A6V8SF32_9CLOT|nr:hypothetical protein bsdtw1_01751 [Clostridium fungisolvens]